MSVNLFLIQLVAFSCAMLLLRARYTARGWLLVAGLLLLVLAGVFWLSQDLAGWISGGLWFGLILIPLVGFARINYLTTRDQYGQARWIASWIRWLHPFDGFWEYPELLRGLELGYEGKLAEATRLLQKYHTRPSRIARTATVLLYRMAARWDEALFWMRQNLPEQDVLKDGTIGLIYLRSLGETGDLNGMLQVFEKFDRHLAKSGNLPCRNLARMMVCAFCGQRDQVEQLFRSSLGIYPEGVRQFWLATADLALANPSARQYLSELATWADPMQQRAIDWRLTQPMANPQEIAIASRPLLAQIARELQQEAQYNLRTAFKQRRAYATYGLILLNTLIFGLELYKGGSTNPWVLYQMGALVPEAVVAGEWWRTLAATFLHFNQLHLLANMVGLYIFGSFVESALGWSRFLLVYLVSGIGSMATIAALALWSNAPDQYCVGASGAVMGLLGVMLAILLHGWQQDRAAIARKQLLFMLFLVGLQTISDLLTPQVSLLGHGAGMILGLVSAYGLFALGTKVRQN